jgi:hypothetical protein
MGFAGQLFDKPGEGKYTQKYFRDLQKKSGSSSTVTEEVKGQNVEEKTVIDRPQKKDRTAGEINGVKQVMGYPIARGPRDSTGDALVIKAIEYIPPTTGLKATKAKGYYAKDGTDSGVPVKAGDVVGVFDKSGNRLGDKQFIGDVKLNNEGASDRQKNSKAIYYITLPIPQDVNDSNVVTWGDDSMNIFQIAAVDAAAGVLSNTKQSFENAKAIIDAGVGQTIGKELGEGTAQAITRAIAGEAINKLGQNIRPNSVLGRSTGMILNSNLELLFSGVSLRTFPFSINFSPRNEEESKMVVSIIKALKSSMAAKKGAGTSGQGGIFLRAPDVFQLRYIDSNGKDHPFLNRIKDCALTAMTVNYTNSGTYATYDDGTPVSIRMNLTFKELNPIYFEDYKDYAGPGVGY